MIAQALRQDLISFEEMADMLGMKPTSLKQRIYNGTDHPPYRKLLSEYVFERSEFWEWFESKPRIYEVHSGR